MPSVVIAIPTLLGGPTLSSCLQALARQSFRDFEVVVVNNGTGPAGIESDTVNFPLQVIATGKNIGFGAAINLAMRHSQANLIATLNDDTEPQENWLAKLVEAIETENAVGMCASKIQLFGTDTLDSAGMLICEDGSSKQRGQFQPVDQWQESGEALLPSGCAALFRRELLDEVGSFDEDFFLYCEDTDLGLRACWAGWKCLYAADAIVAHHYSRTAGAYSQSKARYVERNRLWVAIKNFPLSLLLKLPVSSLMRYLWQLRAVREKQGAAAAFVESGHSITDALGILIAAHWETLTHLPELLRKRADLRRVRKIGSAEFLRTLNRFRISAKDLAYSG